MSTAPFLAPHRDLTVAEGRWKAASNYYTVPGMTSSGGSTEALSAHNLDIYSPIRFDAPTVIDQVAVEVTATNTSTNIRIGLYAADTAWQPVGPPLLDSGSIGTSPTGVKTYTPSTPLYVLGGRYLTVVNAETGAPTLRFVGVNSVYAYSTTLGSNTNISGMRVSRTYAAFPTPGTAWDTVTTGSTNMRSYVFLRLLAA